MITRPENYLLGLANQDIPEEHLSGEVLDRIMALLDLRSLEIEKGARACLQLQAQNHRMARQVIGDRTMASEARQSLKELTKSLQKAAEDLDKLHIIHNMALDVGFREQQKDDALDNIGMMQFEVMLEQFLKAAETLNSELKTGGNRSDFTLEAAIGGLIYFVKYIVDPVRQKYHDAEKPCRPISLDKIAQIATLFMNDLEPNEYRRQTKTFMDTLILKIRRKNPGSKIKIYSHFTALNLEVTPIRK